MTLGITRSTMSSLLLFAAPMLLSCPEQKTKPPADKVEQVRLGQEFKLRVGQQASVQGENFKVKFVSVANDSRCPTDVTCVWAGDAEVMVQADSNGKTADLKLHTNGGDKFPKEARHEKYQVELVALNPHPSKDKGIKPSDYEATLVVHKE